ncbi:MAG: radical SAM protein [Candidatus Tectomicrobia bacterium]|uniref:Radical SAM protein n=1 Tax=Tectimicrobiota bacterium TaxID=2528274 RepID=A0A933GLT4_UNCTE|nr:radical SAM protein [Candidatus Tectomicrobia bacterium]
MTFGITMTLLSFSKTKALLSFSSSSGILRGYAFAPTVVNMSLTYRCNLACPMCWQRRGKEKYGLFRLNPDEELTIRDWEKIVCYFQSIRPFFFLWGGEPFLYAKFLELVAFIKERELTCEVNTNGTYLRETAGSLVDLKLDSLVLSLDGAEEVHDRSRGVKGTFQIIEEGMYLLKKLKKDRNRELPKVRVNFTLTPENYRFLGQMPEILTQWGVESLTISHQWFTNLDCGRQYDKAFQKYFGYEAQSWRGYLQNEWDMDLQILNQELKETKKTLESKNIKTEIFPDLSLDEMKEYYYGLGKLKRFKNCWVPWFVAGIQANGDLVACSDYPDYLVGNLRKTEFRKLWNSRDFRRFRQVLGCQGLFPVCRRCCGLFSLKG